jgi:hypothetical protein
LEKKMVAEGLKIGGDLIKIAKTEEKAMDEFN